jgi:hypothetical protein
VSGREIVHFAAQTSAPKVRKYAVKVSLTAPDFVSKPFYILRLQQKLMPTPGFSPNRTLGAKAGYIFTTLRK